MRLAPFYLSAVLAVILVRGAPVTESSEQLISSPTKRTTDSNPSIHIRDPLKLNLGSVGKEIGKEVGSGLLDGGIDAFTEATSAPTTTACARGVRNGEKRGIGGLARTLGEELGEEGISRIMGGTASFPEPLESC
ncbi:hypothetical protein K435DRAFT_786281 [Dendrothele bispora CBS 962.96]|uniref:Uncharacterized protein n=1 Tax=Dendrothele bispora (strain CBS 962.96) TaxID=1314807 RepID=A0A4S8KRP9_DENBC|nr:hypothetical protein K435DRAFT_786281 [Dendrothele bispora CBS 962.96]